MEAAGRSLYLRTAAEPPRGMVFLLGTVVVDVIGIVLLGKAQGLERPGICSPG